MSALADGYAAAFVDVAKAEGALGVVGAELAVFAQAMSANAQLQQTLTDNAIPADRRQGIVESLLGAKAHPVTTNLVAMVIGAGRGRELPAIAQAFLSSAAGEAGREAGEVRSAYPLTHEQQLALKAAVEKATGKRVELTFLVDPSVLGGVVTRIGDTVIDGSVKSRLEQVKSRV